MWMQDGCIGNMDSYMALHGSCFMVTWIVFKNHLLEVGLTQNRETMALRRLTTVGFTLFYHVWGPAWIEIHWNSIWLRVRSHMTSQYIWGHVTTLHDFGGVLGRTLDAFFWALTISWSWLLSRVWSGPELFNCMLCAIPWSRGNYFIVFGMDSTISGCFSCLFF